MNVIVTLFVDNVVRVAHTWTHVPAVGDRIIMEPGDVVAVAARVWTHSHDGRQRVELHCDTVRGIPGKKGKKK